MGLAIIIDNHVSLNVHNKLTHDKKCVFYIALPFLTKNRLIDLFAKGNDFKYNYFLVSTNKSVKDFVNLRNTF